jgi:hypothetical protein
MYNRLSPHEEPRLAMNEDRIARSLLFSNIPSPNKPIIDNPKLKYNELPGFFDLSNQYPMQQANISEMANAMALTYALSPNFSKLLQIPYIARLFPKCIKKRMLSGASSLLNMSLILSLTERYFLFSARFLIFFRGLNFAPFIFAICFNA